MYVCMYTQARAHRHARMYPHMRAFMVTQTQTELKTCSK